MRYAPAAKQFIIDVAEARTARFTAKPHGDPDPFGTTRSIEFDANTSKWLTPILDAYEDPLKRIAGYESKGGKMVLTFVADYRADLPVSFPLGAIHTVLNDSGDGRVGHDARDGTE